MAKIGGLRTQLGLWHAGLMALTLLALAGFTYALLIGFLHSRADAALEEYADTTARQIADSLYRSGGSAKGQVETRFLGNDIRNWGRYIQVVDPRGEPVEKSDGLNSHPLPVTATTLRRGLEGASTLETVYGLGEHPVRIATVPVRMGPRVPYLVQAATSLEGVEAALQRAGWILAVLTPTVFVLALVGGWLVVGRALRRVDDLTRTALDIQSSNLQRRVQPGDADPNDEIGRLASAFDEMISRLDRSFQQVRQFSADASHELKTPLTAIRGEAEVTLLGDRSPEEYRRSIRSMLESAERMSDIVESLLLLARADSGLNLVRQEPVEFAELLLQAVDGVEALSRRNQVPVIVEQADDLTVLADPLWLGQIVTNLLTNGIKYTPGGGNVHVTLREQSGQAELIVRDTGIGIAPEHLPHIFDRFYRVDHGRARAAGGAGLGLAITHWAVESLGGQLTVESEVGAGSSFTVRLPLAAEQPE